MQLGELQSQLSRFTQRGASIVALSVDPASHSMSMIRRLGLAYTLVGDVDQSVMQVHGVQNLQTQELALHAVFIVDVERRVLYRKVASRRPLSQELLDAIDYHNGVYPLQDEKLARPRTPVGFPQNNFQALIEISTNSVLPATIDQDDLQPIFELIRERKLDDATIKYRILMGQVASSHSEAQLLATAAWLVKTALQMPEEALLTGRALNEALLQQRAIRSAEDVNDAQLLAIEKDLDTLRGVIRNSAEKWRLKLAKTKLRGYRELSLAAAILEYT